MDKIHLLGRKVTLFQPDTGFRTSRDAVLLAAACPAKEQDTVLDMGCGVGGALFCLLWRQPNLKITGIEIEKKYFDLAERNAAENKHNVRFIHQDVLDYDVEKPEARYHHIICNPPYYDPDGHFPSPDNTKAKAKGHMGKSENLGLWIKSARRNLKSNGSLTIIHRAEKLDEIICLLGKSFGATEIVPIQSKSYEPAKRVIIRSYKDRKSPCIIYPAITMHQDNAKPTKVSDLLLREGMSFDTVLKEQRSA